MMRSRLAPDSSRRSGVVLLGVLLVVVVLALLAYQYSDRMTAEYTAAYNAHRVAQARAFAEAGVHYAAAILASPENAGMLNGGPYDNDLFRDVALPDADSKGNGGRFTLVAPADPSDGGSYRAGVTDESGKININAMMKIDPTGDKLYEMLQKLPNMTPDVAAAIVDWVDADTTPREGGAEDEYYSGLANPYRCKNGPLDSLDELLLVRGVTRELLFGSDLNRNNLPDSDEMNPGSVDRALKLFDPNRDPQGQALVYLGDTDLPTLYEKLVPGVGDEVAKFVIMYRQYGASSSSGSSKNLLSSIASMFSKGKSSGGSSTVAGQLGSWVPDLNKKGSQKLNSIYDLVNTQVSIPGKGPKAPTVVYTSPLNDANKLRMYLPKLWQATTTSKDAELAARININTAPAEVIAALPFLTDADVQTITNLRPKTSSSEPASDNFQTPAWLLTDANLKPATLTSLDKYVTTRSQVYSMQVVGMFEDKKGPTARVEAVVDTSFGRPRIVYWRDWTELGRTTLP